MLYSKLKTLGKWYAFFCITSVVIIFTIFEITPSHMRAPETQSCLLVLGFWTALLVTMNFMGSSLASRPECTRAILPRRRRRNSSPQLMSGIDFEYWVADQLRECGWHTWVSPSKGDQGIDIIATRWFTRIGIQCKRYKGSVGNAAIQQVFAGKAYYRLDAAAVITTGYYTKSAKDLARKTNVMLLTIDDIPNLKRVYRMRKREKRPLWRPLLNVRSTD